MTGYTVHTGTSAKFSEGWDRIFAGESPTKAKKASAKKKSANSAKPAEKPRSSAKLAAKKTAGKRVSAGKVQSKRAALRSRSSGKS